MLDGNSTPAGLHTIIRALRMSVLHRATIEGVSVVRHSTAEQLNYRSGVKTHPSREKRTLTQEISKEEEKRGNLRAEGLRQIAEQEFIRIPFNFVTSLRSNFCPKSEKTRPRK